MKYAFDWIDRIGRDSDIYDHERSRLLYQEFTAHLEEKYSKKTFKINSAVRHQEGLRDILSAGLEIKPSEIEGWLPKLNLQNNYGVNAEGYIDLETYEIHGDSTDRAPKNINPERVVLVLGLGNEKINIAKLCYLDRMNLNPDVHSSSVLGRKVNPSSLCSKRCEILRKVVEQAVIGALPDHRVRHIRVIIEWLDRNERGSQLHSLKDAKRLYVDYTQLCLHEIQLSQVGEKKRSTIDYVASNQDAMATLISLALNITLLEVKNWSPLIYRRQVDIPQPRLNENEARTAYHLHSRFFWAYSQVVLSDTPALIPLVVRLKDLGHEDFIAFSNKNVNYSNYEARSYKKSWRLAAFSEEGFDTDLQSVERKAIERGLRFSEVDKNKHLQVKLSLETKGFQFDDLTLKHFLNRAMKHFGHMLLYASGCNSDHLNGIDCDSVKLSKDSGGGRIIAYKGRVQNELQKLSVPNVFQKEWRQMMRLRAKMASWYGKKLPRFGLFFVPVVRNKSNNYSALDAINISQSIAWPVNGPGLTTRTPRKIKIQKLLEISGGDIVGVGNMVSNKPQTIRKHYAFKTFEDSAKQLTKFFVALKSSANLRVSGKAEAPVVNSGSNIPSGKCIAKSIDDRQYIDGIDENRAPELSCGAPLACFFCKSFGILNEYEDILRILSVAAYIRAQSNQKALTIDTHKEKFLPVIARIEEIIEAFRGRGSSEKEIVELATESVKKGELDPFWLAQLNALLDAMELL